ncbi:MAG: hypothetical protein ACR2M1_04215 [Gemmatimonadaceae bacterium]
MSDLRSNRSVSSLRQLANRRVGDATSVILAPDAVANRGVATQQRIQPPDHMCGQRALAFACGRSVQSVVNALGHCGPLTVREIRRFFEQHTRLRLTELGREALSARPAEIWWSFGARRFIALLVQFDSGRPDGMGHAFVLEGRTLLDPDSAEGDVMIRVPPAALARFDYAFILSARENAHE